MFHHTQWMNYSSLKHHLCIDAEIRQVEQCRLAGYKWQRMAYTQPCSLLRLFPSLWQRVPFAFHSCEKMSFSLRFYTTNNDARSGDKASPVTVLDIVKESSWLCPERHQVPASNPDTEHKGEDRRPQFPHTHLDWVCFVILRMVAPSFPIMAPTNWVGTSRRSGRSQGFCLDTDPGDVCLDEPRCPAPRRPRSCGEGFCWAAVSSGM